MVTFQRWPCYLLFFSWIRSIPWNINRNWEQNFFNEGKVSSGNLGRELQYMININDDFTFDMSLSGSSSNHIRCISLICDNSDWVCSKGNGNGLLVRSIRCYSIDLCRWRFRLGMLANVSIIPVASQSLFCTVFYEGKPLSLVLDFCWGLFSFLVCYEVWEFLNFGDDHLRYLFKDLVKHMIFSICLLVPVRRVAVMLW